jgi:Family of unknown function (DUF6338)
MFEPMNLGLYLLFFVPGFIFIQTIERHLVREKKPQFEKTIEIFLWSAFIWMIAIYVPLWVPFGSARENFLLSVREYLIPDLCELNHKVKIHNLLNNINNGIAFFFTVCLWTFVIANIWGVIRKQKIVDALIKWLTGRDWYPSVSFKFFQNNIGKAIEVKVAEKQYLGILHSAPDTKEDKYIIVTEPYLLVNDKKGFHYEQMALVKSIIVKFEDISQINAYKEDILKSKK